MDDFESLRICPKCDCRLCFESAAEPLTAELWLVVVQCPNCWFAWRRQVTDLVLELFEYALDDDARVIEAELDELASANRLSEAKRLAAEAARFMAALEADAIVPMDF
jgi:hypothetical protein